ncbi:MAG: hypothetical protein QXX45_03920 [Candidatus Aenigmatarchaeota archaeon]
MSQLVEEHRSLWRLKKYYVKDAKNCKKCKELWQQLLKEKSQHIKRISEILKAHNL